MKNKLKFAVLGSIVLILIFWFQYQRLTQNNGIYIKPLAYSYKVKSSDSVITIGSSAENTIPVINDYADDQHVRLEVQNINSYVLKNVSDKRHLYVNGSNIYSVKLKIGDTLSLYDHKYKLLSSPNIPFWGGVIRFQDLRHGSVIAYRNWTSSSLDLNKILNKDKKGLDKLAKIKITTQPCNLFWFFKVPAYDILVFSLIAIFITLVWFIINIDQFINDDLKRFYLVCLKKISGIFPGLSRIFRSKKSFIWLNQLISSVLEPSLQKFLEFILQRKIDKPEDKKSWWQRSLPYVFGPVFILSLGVGFYSYLVISESYQFQLTAENVSSANYENIKINDISLYDQHAVLNMSKPHKVKFGFTEYDLYLTGSDSLKLVPGSDTYLVVNSKFPLNLDSLFNTGRNNQVSNPGVYRVSDGLNKSADLMVSVSDSRQEFSVIAYWFAAIIIFYLLLVLRGYHPLVTLAFSYLLPQAVITTKMLNLYSHRYADLFHTYSATLVCVVIIILVVCIGLSFIKRHFGSVWYRYFLRYFKLRWLLLSTVFIVLFIIIQSFQGGELGMYFLGTNVQLFELCKVVLAVITAHGIVIQLDNFYLAEMIAKKQDEENNQKKQPAKQPDIMNPYWIWLFPLVACSVLAVLVSDSSPFFLFCLSFIYSWIVLWGKYVKWNKSVTIIFNLMLITLVSLALFLGWIGLAGSSQLVYLLLIPVLYFVILFLQYFGNVVIHYWRNWRKKPIWLIVFLIIILVFSIKLSSKVDLADMAGNVKEKTAMSRINNWREPWNVNNVQFIKSIFFLRDVSHENLKMLNTVPQIKDDFALALYLKQFSIVGLLSFLAAMGLIASAGIKDLHLARNKNENCTSDCNRGKSCIFAKQELKFCPKLNWIYSVTGMVAFLFVSQMLVSLGNILGYTPIMGQPAPLISYSIWNLVIFSLPCMLIILVLSYPRDGGQIAE